jgi:hypothetical protein
MDPTLKSINRLEAKSAVFWVPTPCSFEKSRCFGGTYATIFRVEEEVRQETSRNRQQAQLTLKVEVICSSETSGSFRTT